MKLFYTTSRGADTKQMYNRLSLGGYKSSSYVPNDSMSNLFSAITPYGLKVNKSMYVCIFLVNDTGSDVENIRIYFDYPEGAVQTLSVGAVAPAKDADNNDIVERMMDIYTPPSTVVFYEADGVDNEVNIGALTDGESVALYIKREVDVDAVISEWEDRISKTEGENVYVEEELELEESIGMELNWDIV